MFKIRKLFKFEMAHALSKSYSQECQTIHGHSYILEVVIGAASVNKDGMVIDFKLLKEIVTEKVIDVFDHGFVMCDIPKSDKSDTFIKLMKEFTGTDIIFVNYNPTAEAMALDIYTRLYSAVRNQVKTLVELKIRLHETETGYAEYLGGF